MSTAWSFLTLEADERQFEGNAGYADDLARHYSWDETVTHHDKIHVGDLAVIRDHKFVLGFGWIDEVLDWKGDKDRYRCPHCNKTGFKRRTTIEPKYYCPACKNTFDVASVEHLTEITMYMGDYARTWRASDAPLPVAAIKPAYLTGATQQSMREMDLEQVRKIVDAEHGPGDMWWASSSVDGTLLPGGHFVVIGKARIGQQHFRGQQALRFQ